MFHRFGIFLPVSLVLTLTCISVVLSKGVQFKDCGSKDAKVSKVDIMPCSTSPCQVVPGKNSTINLFFAETVAADNVTSKAYGSIAGVKIPYPLPHPDACKDSNITCPLKAGAKYDYVVTLPIPKGLPEVDVVVELDMIAGDGTKVICVDFPLTVMPNGYQQQQMHP